MTNVSPRFLAVAHGTASRAGSATTARLVDAIRAARPDTEVDLCFLDVASPRLADALDERPAVVVPLLLSTGYHVQTDIPAAVAPYPTTRVARHLGPDPLLADVLVDRLGELGTSDAVALVGAGSTRPEARTEISEMGRLVGVRVGRAVTCLTLADDVRATLESLTQPVRVVTYLLAEGQFVESLREAAEGLASVADPIGVHPALVRLVWQRYFNALDGSRSDG